MKKILLITLFDEFNIGNRLQNYALQKKLESYGFKVITLDNGYSKIYSFKTRTKYIIKKMLGYLGYNKYSEECRKYDHFRKIQKTIRKFNCKNISNIICNTNQGFFESDWHSYDYAIAGSDQIWHKWRNDEYELPYYYLQFLPPEKRVSYAASFGFESFPESDLEQHRAGLQGMKEISCREESGCKLVEELIGRKVPRVLDPTLLLSANEWRELEKQADNYANKEDNFAFSFFLGNISDEYREYIAKTMSQNGINKLIDFNDEKTGVCGPCEFLSWIDNARFVFTDSFHCVVFSLIFEKKLIAFRRIQKGMERMFGRIEDLLSSTNKLECIYGGTNKIPKNNLTELYQESIQYLESVLETNNEN